MGRAYCSAGRAAVATATATAATACAARRAPRVAVPCNRETGKRAAPCAARRAPRIRSSSNQDIAKRATRRAPRVIVPCKQDIAKRATRRAPRVRSSSNLDIAKRLNFKIYIGERAARRATGVCGPRNVNTAQVNPASIAKVVINACEFVSERRVDREVRVGERAVCQDRVTGCSACGTAKRCAQEFVGRNRDPAKRVFGEVRDINKLSDVARQTQGAVYAIHKRVDAYVMSQKHGFVGRT